MAGERGVSRRLRLVEGGRREAGRVPDTLIRRVRGAVIEVEGIGKSFGETRALVGVDMSVPAGTVQGLLGPNRAGKTTLVRDGGGGRALIRLPIRTACRDRGP
jgi:ATPase subunit of ABC transporter with duplicated ATPase domains